MSSAYDQHLQSLLSRTFTLAEVQATGYFGPNGVVGGNPAVLPLFDFRPYKRVHVMLQAQGMTGTSIQLAGFVFSPPNGDISQHPGFAHENSQCDVTLTASGGGWLILDSRPPYSANTGVGHVNSVPLTIAPKGPFMQFSIQGTSLTVLTALQVEIYGERH